MAELPRRRRSRRERCAPCPHTVPKTPNLHTVLGAPAERSTSEEGTIRGLVPERPASLARRLTWVSASKGAIPRKEVIQPQLPLRLPCYDFVPITSPALDGCPPEGLAPRLQALPAFVT